MLIVMTVESLRDEIDALTDTLVELKAGFDNENEIKRQSIKRTQRMIRFKNEQLMEMLRAGKKRIEIRV